MAWEYKISEVEVRGMIRKLDVNEVEERLNELGAEGFELDQQSPVSGNWNHTPAVGFIMRRPR